MKDKLFLLATAFLISGCSEEQVVQPEQCLNVNQTLTTRLGASVSKEDGGDGVFIVDVSAVKSPDHKNAFYIAAELEGPGLEKKGDYIVWLSNKLTDKLDDGSYTSVFSIGAVAKEFSKAPTPDELKSMQGPSVSILDVGYKQAIECVKLKQTN